MPASNAILAAHGYLISQFLSPVDNHRTDEYGGSLEGRMRFLIEIYQGMRETLGPDFPIAVKLNSSDGDLGGMSQEDSLRVAVRLSELGVDVLEVSGGTYRKPVFEETDSSAEDHRRGVYFADYARRLKELVSMPVALTGGFRSASDMEEAVVDGVTDLVGIGRPLALIPDLPQRILDGAGRRRIELPRISTRVKALDEALGGVLLIGWYEMQAPARPGRLRLRSRQRAGGPGLHGAPPRARRTHAPQGAEAWLTATRCALTPSPRARSLTRIGRGRMSGVAYVQLM